MKKLLYSILLILAIVVCACGDKENDEPTNSVFAFSSTDKNVSVTNQGLNAVVNVGAMESSFSIPINGTFIHADIEEECSWLDVKIEDKTLKLSFSHNYLETSRSANIAIKANDLAEIVIANVAVNQAGLTAADYAVMEDEDIQFMVDWYGGAQPVPADLNLEKGVLYQLNAEGSAFMKIMYRAQTPVRINKGDVVYPHWMVCHPNDVLYDPAYFDHGFLNNNDTFREDYFTYDGITHELIAKYGKGILLPLENGICYGDDIDLIIKSDLALPELQQYKFVRVYVVQYYMNGQYQPIPNHAPAKRM